MIQSVLPQLNFSFYRHQPIRADFSGGQITSDAGLLPLRAFDQRYHLTPVNVNTCDVPGFMTLAGTCGPFNVTWNEEPVSVGGFFVTRGDTKFTLFGGGILVINGESANFGALATGTALGFGSAVPQVGNVFQETNVNVFFSAP